MDEFHYASPARPPGAQQVFDSLDLSLDKRDTSEEVIEVIPEENPIPTVPLHTLDPTLSDRSRDAGYTADAAVVTHNHTEPSDNDEPPPLVSVANTRQCLPEKQDTPAPTMDDQDTQTATLRGVDDRALTIFTAYRVCTSTARNAPLGSAFLREHDFLRENNQASENPRRTFLTDLQKVILELLASGHEIILMLDANSTLEDDQHFSDFINVCSLSDLHESDPAPSTYIGAPARRIDYIFGTSGVKGRTIRSGTLSYYEGPQSDHRGLYIDLKKDFLIFPTCEIASSKHRSLHTGNPELVDRYLEEQRSLLQLACLAY